MISKFTELYQENQNEQKLRYESLAKDFAALLNIVDTFSAAIKNARADQDIKKR